MTFYPGIRYLVPLAFFLALLAGCSDNSKPLTQAVSSATCEGYGVPGCYYLHRAPEEDEIKSSLVSPQKIELTTTKQNLSAYTSETLRIALNEVAINPTGEIFAAGGPGLSILKSSRALSNWKIDTFSGWGDYLRGITFTKDGAGFAVGNSARVFKTIAGGDSWTLYNPGFNSDDDPHLKNLEYTFSRSAFAIDFFDINNGLIVGEEFILSTQNGGKDWNRVNAKIDGLALQKLSIVDHQTAWTVGSNGTMLVTTDKGATWKQVNLTADEEAPHLMGVSFSSTTSGCVGGEHQVWCTSDAGSTWAQAEIQPTPFGSTITNLKMQDGNNGWFINRTGAIYKTENGGKNWSRWLNFPEVSGQVFSDVELWGLALDSKNVWAVGMVRSKDVAPNVVNAMNPLIMKWDAK
ncbi:WD40/YVTN/BNR-like repeat-containing protein [Pseudomonas sp.]|uniref:WD40/YVTN/BNR-like repeat-containing protein n=1 Tax=Pseudomonas sp. TaxID=306 RepID=UPI0035621643